MKKYKILFVDLEGTIITTASGKSSPQGLWDMKFKVGVLNKIKELEPEYIFIVINNSSIGKFIDEDDYVKKLDYVEAAVKNYVKHKKFKAIETMYCSSGDRNDEFWKPNPGMLYYFIQKYDFAARGYTLDDMLMIGDASGNNNNYSDADIRTAEKAHIRYLDVNDFQQAAFFD